MSICEYCGEDMPKTTVCRMCGKRFCSEDGYLEKNLCFECATGEEEGAEDAIDKTLEENEGVEEEEE